MPSHWVASQTDIRHMQAALSAARAAADRLEVPVGAVVVAADGSVLATTGNSPIALNDPSAHAEILALREAGQRLRNYRLTGCTLYVSLEPCPMCLSAIAMARLPRLVYGASDPRLGACGGALNLAADTRLNAHTTVHGGLLKEESAALLSEFFRDRRPPPAERLLRIRSLTDLPNIDPATAIWLEQRGWCSPASLSDCADPDGLVQWLAQCTDEPERAARLRALHHFIQGGPALPWRTFLNTDDTQAPQP